MTPEQLLQEFTALSYREQAQTVNIILLSMTEADEKIRIKILAHYLDEYAKNVILRADGYQSIEETYPDYLSAKAAELKGEK